MGLTQRCSSSWLEKKPNKALFAAWKDYVQELSRVMSADALSQLRERTKSLCNQVAKAARGVMGFGSISAAERQAIDECANTWKGKQQPSASCC